MANEDTGGRNVGEMERALSLLGGGALVCYALTRPGNERWLWLASGAGLLYRGVSAHCPYYGAIGKDSTQTSIGGEGQFSRPIPGHGGILVEEHITINKSPEELYNFWRGLENLPRFMRHLKSVEVVDDTTSRWQATAPAGLTVSWDAEIIRDEANELIAWRSKPGSTVPNSGSVQFKAAPANRGTEMRVILEYEPPAGQVGATLAALFGEEPHRQVEDDLRRFKQLMETGEITTIEGQPHGAR